MIFRVTAAIAAALALASAAAAQPAPAAAPADASMSYVEALFTFCAAPVGNRAQFVRTLVDRTKWTPAVEEDIIEARRSVNRITFNMPPIEPGFVYSQRERRALEAGWWLESRKQLLIDVDLTTSELVKLNSTSGESTVVTSVVRSLCTITGPTAADAPAAVLHLPETLKAFSANWDARYAITTSNAGQDIEIMIGERNGVHATFSHRLYQNSPALGTGQAPRPIFLSDGGAGQRPAPAGALTMTRAAFLAIIGAGGQFHFEGPAVILDPAGANSRQEPAAGAPGSP